MLRAICVLGILALAVHSGNAFARCAGTMVMGECHGAQVPSGSSNSQHESSSGARYQYDLNNPVDRNRYSTDLDAQRRDQMSVNPRQKMDRSSGQFGGGIYD